MCSLLVPIFCECTNNHRSAGEAANARQIHYIHMLTSDPVVWYQVCYTQVLPVVDAARALSGEWTTINS